jgi:hypothetical protein
VRILGRLPGRGVFLGRQQLLESFGALLPALGVGAIRALERLLQAAPADIAGKRLLLLGRGLAAVEGFDDFDGADVALELGDGAAVPDRVVDAVVAGL